MSCGRIWQGKASLALVLLLVSGGLYRGYFRLVAQAPQTLPAAPTALPTQAPSGMALLIRGPDKALGLPFFSPNAIPILRGSYLLSSDEVNIWFTREPLVFGGTWSADRSWTTKAGERSMTMKTPDGRLDLALSNVGWTVILELPSSDATVHRFVAAFVDRFTFFLDNAHDDAELSFPATVAH